METVALSRQRIWQLKHPDKDRAHHAVADALKSGKLIRPGQCERCNTEGPVQAHHASYERAQWLNVAWLCAQCHLAVDREANSHRVAVKDRDRKSVV